jgi:hypothetical protein
MSTTTEQTTDTTVIVAASQQSATEIPDVCKPGDRECIARLVQAFSDCD